MSMYLNHSKAKPVFPLLMLGYDKEKCMEIVKNAGLEIPEMYKLGFDNNNCFQTMCIQGGVGYWQKVQREYPEKFEAMAQLEHELTELKGEPVTMLKDQSNEAKAAKEHDGKAALVFLKKHPDYPNKCLVDMSKQEVAPLKDCNGFCGIDEMNAKNETYQQLNFGE